MSYKCVIVDDEPIARRLLKMHISKLDDFEIVAECKNALELNDVLDKHQIDLIFLDIEMPLIKGSDFLRLYEVKPKVIFTTAHRDYAIEAFELDALDYLLKPISFDRFNSAIEKFISVTPQIDYLEKNSITVSFNRKKMRIYCEDILYIESLRDYVRIVMNSKEIKTKVTLSGMEADLDENFLRIHRSYIVNRKKITSFSKTKVDIGKAHSLPIGKTYQEQVLDDIQ